MWKIKLLCLAVVSVFVTGCLRDDLSDCDQGIELIFEYTHHNYDADLFCSEVSKVTIMAFDNSNVFASLYTEDIKAENSGNFTMSLPLEKGNYTLLIFGGPLDTYHVGEPSVINRVQPGSMNDINSIRDFRLLLHEDESKQEEMFSYAVSPTELFYGKINVEVVSRQKLSYKANLMKNSSSVTLRIKDKVKEEQYYSDYENIEVPFNIFFSGKNTMINSENEIVDEAPEYRYSSINSKYDTDANCYDIDYSMMRLMIGHPVNLKIEDYATGKILLDEELINLILQYKTKYINQNDLDKEDNFLVEVEIDRNPSGGNIAVTVRINGWTIIKMKPVI